MSDDLVAARLLAGASSFDTRVLRLPGAESLSRADGAALFLGGASHVARDGGRPGVALALSSAYHLLDRGWDDFVRAAAPDGAACDAPRIQRVEPCDAAAIDDVVHALGGDDFVIYRGLVAQMRVRSPPATMAEFDLAAHLATLAATLAAGAEHAAALIGRPGLSRALLTLVTLSATSWERAEHHVASVRLMAA